MFCPSQIKNYIITGLVSNFFNASCNRVTSSLQKRNQHKSTNSWYFLITIHLQPKFQHFQLHYLTAKLLISNKYEYLASSCFQCFQITLPFIAQLTVYNVVSVRSIIRLILKYLGLIICICFDPLYMKFISFEKRTSSQCIQFGFWKLNEKWKKIENNP